MYDTSHLPAARRVRRLTPNVVREVALYYTGRPSPFKPEPINNPQSAVQVLRKIYSFAEPRERMVALLLDARYQLLGWHTVSVGTLTESLVHPREIFAPALHAYAAAVILAHNHPSGDPTPSNADRTTTRRIRDAGELLGIKLLDSLVIAGDQWTSLHNMGWPAS